MSDGINQLPKVASASAGDLAAIYSSANGADSAISLTALSALLSTLITLTNNFITQYAAPGATGFTVTILSPQSGLAVNVWLVLTPLAGYAAGTITLPDPATCVLGQEILVNCTQAVTTLTINGSGASVIGAPTTLAANARFRLKFEPILKTWYAV